FIIFFHRALALIRSSTLKATYPKSFCVRLVYHHLLSNKSLRSLAHSTPLITILASSLIPVKMRTSPKDFTLIYKPIGYAVGLRRMTSDQVHGYVRVLMRLFSFMTNLCLF